MQKYRNRLVIGFASAVLIYAVYLFIVETRTESGALIFLRQFPVWLLLPMVVLQLLAFFFRWIEWHYYLGVIGAQHKISIADSMILQMASFTMTVSPGKAGELLKSVILKSKTGTDIARSAPVVLAERVVDGIAVILMLAVAVALGGETTHLQPWQRNSILFSAGVLSAGLVAVQLRPLAYFFLRAVGAIPFVKRSQSALTAFYESSREVFRLRHVIPMIGIGFGVYGCSAITMYLILVGFGATPTTSLFLLAVITSGVSAAVGALSGSPNGAGVTEGSTQFILMSTLGYGAGLALAVGLLHGLFNKWFRVFLGMIVGFLFRDRLFVGNIEEELQQAEQGPSPVQQATP